jgi:1-aminocyclopropane-1-carboxylate deaminase
MNFKLKTSINQALYLDSKFNIQLVLKREDQIHPIISGNKFRKLKYNLEEAKLKGFKTLLTLGGAFSNHIAAVAEVGKQFGFKTIGVISGEELVDKIEENPTLKLAQQAGMNFKFVTREAYRNKSSKQFIEGLKQEFGDFYLIPEGGTNDLAIKGCKEILSELDKDFNYICCSVGTGGTISGLINCSKPSQQILGFSALKGDFLKEDIGKFVEKKNWQLITDYHFGGYAKINEELISFINEFKSNFQIPLDPIYTGKMMYGIFDLMEKRFFQHGSKILVIHTGGLQGIEGMNKKLKVKGLPLIK